ncbi:MAG TPA: N-acetylmuramoyl-L-alanine amidase [Longimicrobium sp.]|nr:N-acetylmuramoyl-L-alanine amidase [Longimicrobium sp.]
MDHVFETENWPFVRARHFKKIEGRRAVRVIVIHDMEFPETKDAAEVIARDFANTSTIKSAHICVDSNSIVQCVLDNDVAFAAPGANSDGIQIELTGFAKQTRAQWLDPYGVLLMDRGADAAAQYCLKYDIPVRQLTNGQLGDKQSKGLVGHAQVSAVFKKSDHTDPGKNFPWDFFLERVKHHLTRRATQAGKVAIPFVAEEPVNA